MELTGIGSVLRGLGDLYLLLAIACIAAAAIKPAGWKRKAIATTVVSILFGILPAKSLMEKSRHDAYAREAWAYFKKLCDEKSGERIYKTLFGGEKRACGQTTAARHREGFVRSILVWRSVQQRYSMGQNAVSPLREHLLEVVDGPQEYPSEA